MSNSEFDGVAIPVVDRPEISGARIALWFCSLGRRASPLLQAPITARQDSQRTGTDIRAESARKC